jgi:Flp pilus assembly protein TadG
MPVMLLDVFRNKRLGCCGAAAVEFALLLPTLVILLMGMFDYGALAYDKMQVSAAAHAGADYAFHNGFDAGGIQTAVGKATTLATAVKADNPPPQSAAYCVVNGALVKPTGSTCASGGAPGTYVVVNAYTSFSPLVAWSAFVFPSTITAQAMVRIS